MILQSDNATFLYNRDFMDYHADRFQDYSLLIYKKDTLFAILPANRVEGTLHSHQGLTYGGFVYKAVSKFKDVLEVFKAVLKYLQENNIEILRLKTLPNIYTKTPSDVLNYLSFLVKANIYRKDVISVIRPNEKRFSNDRKKGFKRGLKHKLVIEEVIDFSAFWNEVLVPNLKEKYDILPVHSLEEITLLKEKFPNNIRQFNVYRDSKIVAGATIFETEQVAHVQYISGNTDKNELGSLDYLHIHLIIDMFKEKTYFDFGMSHTNDGKINEGLHYWKEGFGAYAVTQDFYEIESKNHTLLDDLFI